MSVYESAGKLPLIANPYKFKDRYTSTGNCDADKMRKRFPFPPAGRLTVITDDLGYMIESLALYESFRQGTGWLIDYNGFVD